ncbi:TPA: hypothetical protein ACIJWT_001897 [Klebsiella aerogenes]|uniref:hypothetical protein n=1 Tax=Klebsiella aerogenes TaxID=548 RepID=UPI00277BE299|nr:hypothetical protein [Klebsiella aerogenes]HBT2857124.1 hypothetical protein [Klebsiella aerogenes]HCC8504726.1 hypothetical protein [Klebsiella aerogenes]HCM7803920.1 hypothetical protein [Klebsiella aerogenes]HDS4022564.1 hypothetical protein [Klebsiella aerogenes]
MKTHDRLRIVFVPACQNWRAFSYFMHVHENCYIKRAGVAGIRARAAALNGEEPIKILDGFALARWKLYDEQK